MLVLYANIEAILSSRFPIFANMVILRGVTHVVTTKVTFLPIFPNISHFLEIYASKLLLAKLANDETFLLCIYVLLLLILKH